MPKISDARRAQRRTDIMDAALRCFLRSGYQQTSMADIIAESGLSAGAIYGYFPSKQELIRGVAMRIIEGRRVELSHAGDAAVSPAQIMVILVEGVRAEAPLAALVQVWAEATVDPDVRGMLQGALGGLRETLVVLLERWANATHRADARAWAVGAAPVLMSLVPGFVLQSTLIDGFDEDAFVAAIPAVLP